MHSLITSRTVGIAGLLVSGLLGACSDGGDEGILITKNVAVSDVVGGCVFSGSPTEPFLPHGAVSVLSQGYLLHPQFLSRIQFDAADPAQMSQRTAIMTDANIDITFPDATLFSAGDIAAMKAAGLTHFKELFSVPVPPNGTADAEVEVVHRPLIDKIIAQNPAGDVEFLVSLTVNGTMSGQAISSQRFDYPVTLTSGLVTNAGTCPLPMGTILPSTGNPCNPFQDSQVTCCDAGSGQLLCPAEVSAK